MSITCRNCGFDENPETTSYCEACGCELFTEPSLTMQSKELNLKYDPTIEIKLKRPSISPAEILATAKPEEKVGIENLMTAKQLLNIVSKMTTSVGNTQLNSCLYEAQIELDKIIELLVAAREINMLLSDLNLLENINSEQAKLLAKTTEILTKQQQQK